MNKTDLKTTKNYKSRLIYYFSSNETDGIN